MSKITSQNKLTKTEDKTSLKTTTKESYVAKDTTLYPDVWSTSFNASIISVRNEVTSP